MTPDEDQALFTLGRIVLNNLLCAVAAILLLGIYIVLFFRSATTSWARRRSRPTSSNFIFAFTWIIFLSTLIRTSSVFALPLVQIKLYFFNLGRPLTERRSDLLHSRAEDLLSLQYYLMGVVFNLADSITVWRALMISDVKALFVKLSFAALLLGSIATAILYASVTSAHDRNAFTDPQVGKYVLISSIIMSFVANVLATALVARKAWRHRRHISKVISHPGKRSLAERTLILLIESGAFFCMLQITFAVATLVSATPLSPLDNFRQVVQECAISLAAIYPTILNNLAIREKSSAWDDLSGTFSHTMASLPPMEFSLPSGGGMMTELKPIHLVDDRHNIV